VNSIVEKERIALVMDEVVKIGVEIVLVLGIDNTRIGRYIGSVQRVGKEVKGGS